MKTAGRKSVSGLKDDCEIKSDIDKIVEDVEKNENCEFIRILEQFSKMNVADRKKLMDYAEKL